MADPKIQPGRALRSEMIAVARGERPAPPDAGRHSYESAEAAKVDKALERSATDGTPASR